VPSSRENCGDFFAGHDHGDVDLLGGAYGIDAALQGVIEDALVEEHQGIHGLVLGAAATLPCTARSVRNDSILGSAGKRSWRDRMPSTAYLL